MSDDNNLKLAKKAQSQEIRTKNTPDMFGQPEEMLRARKSPK